MSAQKSANDLLSAAVAATGCPFTGVGVLGPLRQPDPEWTASGQMATHPTLGPVRIDFAPAATAAQKLAARNAVAAADVTQTEGQRLDDCSPPPRVLAALLIRASGQWTGLSAARKARVQQVIDDAAADAVARLT